MRSRARSLLTRSVCSVLAALVLLVTQPLEARARSYLHANCAQCHRFKGGGNSDFNVLYHLSLADTHTVGAMPLHGDLDISDARLIAPGDPEKSIIYRRMVMRGPGRMPNTSSLEVDSAGAQVIRRWIEGMKAAGIRP